MFSQESRIAGLNDLIESLTQVGRRKLIVLGEPVQLGLSETLCKLGAPTRHVYFPTGGFVALIAGTDAGLGVETGMVGSEGMLGAQLALGVAIAPLHAVVQGAGLALRVPASAFVRELAGSDRLRSAMNRYLYVLMRQMATAASCQRFHTVVQRLARWLLMSQDRSRADVFFVTQEFLAYVLGVRRVGVTTAAGALQRAGLIGYRRGNVEVLDRAGLELVACRCYLADRRVYDGQFPRHAVDTVTTTSVLRGPPGEARPESR